MQFAEAQMFGRTGRRCLRVLSDFAEGHKQKLQTKDVFFFAFVQGVAAKQRAQRNQITLQGECCHLYGCML